MTNIINSYRFGGLEFDADAADYFARIVTAGSTISEANKTAVNAFVVGCKDDGIWSAIKASCILAGADTLAGALVPLVGPAPTNVGPFVAGEYSRTTGLKGNGAKHLDSNMAGNAVANANISLGAWLTELPTPNTTRAILGNGIGSTGSAGLVQSAINIRRVLSRSRNITADPIINGIALGMIGASRSNDNNYVYRYSGTNATVNRVVQASATENFRVFSRGASEQTRGDQRKSFYWFGEDLNLALLDARLTTLMGALT